jgi:hypothetical protein
LINTSLIKLLFSLWTLFKKFFIRKIAISSLAYRL